MRQRLLLLGLVLAFVTPFALGWGLYAFDWRPQQVKPHGVLVTPALAVATGDWHQPDGAAATAGQWTLALLQTGDCGDACRRSLYLMRQIEATQAREASRVQRAVLTDTASASLQREVAAIGHTEIWQGPLAGLAAGLPDATAALAIVDPMGNLMMVYPPDFDPSGVRRDLERLLKFSWIG